MDAAIDCTRATAFTRRDEEVDHDRHARSVVIVLPGGGAQDALMDSAATGIRRSGKRRTASGRAPLLARAVLWSVGESNP